MLDEDGIEIGSEQMAELVGDAGNTVWPCLYLKMVFKIIPFA